MAQPLLGVVPCGAQAGVLSCSQVHHLLHRRTARCCVQPIWQTADSHTLRRTLKTVLSKASKLCTSHMSTPVITQLQRAYKAWLAWP